MENTKQMTPSIWMWSVFNPEKNLFFNGFYIEGEKCGIIDPPTPKDPILDLIEKHKKPDYVYLTNKHHTRATEVFRRKFDCQVFVHERDKKLMEIPLNGTFRDGEALPCGLQVVGVPNSKTPGEAALYHAGEKAMIVGDAVIGDPEGELRMLPDEKFSDPKKARSGLNVLLEYDFEHLLLGDGHSILKNGKATLTEFLRSS